MNDRETVLDLFAGPGAGAYGFAPYFDVVEAIEADAHAAASYAANHHKTRVRCMRVEDYFAQRNDADGLTLDGALVTPPCQGWSPMNTRTRGRDARCALTPHSAELVTTLKPRWVVMENVPPSPAAQERVRLTFTRWGYNVRMMQLDASHYGAAQRRKRWIVVATRPGRKLAELQRAPAETVREAFQRLPPTHAPDMHMRPETAARLASIPPTGAWMSSGRAWDDVVRLSWDKPAPAMLNVAKCYILHPEETRKLSTTEAMTLFGLPGTYKLVGDVRSRGQQVANMVPAPLARAIAQALSIDAGTPGTLTPTLHAYEATA